ncbi:MAG: hypothetical protein ACXVB4_14245 [Pseudobdellovibrionaceae bacterium]
MNLSRKGLAQLFFFIIGAALSQSAGATCDQTLSPGANVASAISSAADGSTVCLNGGDYGSMTLSNISKSSAVTLQSASGVGATIGITALSSSNNLIFKNLTLSTLMWSGNANTNIKILNNTFTGQLYIFGNGNGSPQHNLVDGNTFDGISVCTNCREGRVQLYGANDLVVSNNHFGKAGESDGIQWGGYGGTVGPGNIFDGLVQCLGNTCYTRHVDSIQQYGEVDHQTITGNFFINDTVGIGTYDSSANVTVTNNIFIGTDTNLMRCVIDFGSSTNLNFNHNTLINVPQMRAGALNYTTGSSGSILNNIFMNYSFSEPGAGFSGTVDHNQFTSSDLVIGTNPLIGIPVFIGGSSPSTWAGYQLTSTSPGYKASLDGKDMGTNYYGMVTNPPTSTSLSAPKNLRIL